ncbi:pectinesterase-like [Salvia miltiorrhiza]|uniref:pectinesterase-like n=1 Tax=Salvia miltiorrhiza TaxID=226208 RepID=UPI0025AD45B8|nr:pectinesterase-like [Salvia miltiorrhiza]
MGDSNNKITVAATFLVVACLVSAAAAYGDSPQIDAMCSNAEYKETCQKTLASANNTEPKELLLSAFNSTIRNLKTAIRKSKLYNDAAADPRTKGALAVCEQVLNTTVENMRRSFRQVDKIDVNQIDDYVDDVKVWLSAGLTCKDTCVDAFENTTGETGDKIKDLLKTSGELLSNGLAIVSGVSKLFESLDIGKLLSGSKRVLEQTVKDSVHGGAPGFVGHHARSLLGAAPGSFTPNAVVAQDGSGKYKTIKEAIAAAPLNSDKLFIIQIKAGVYKEVLKVPGGANNVVFVGEGPTKTVISGSQSFAGGIPAFQTAILSIDGDDFMAKDIGIENTAGASGRQAIAVRVSGDKAVFYNVHMSSYQSTLYAHIYRQFYRDCRITGTMDIIWGDAVAVFQNCNIAVRQPLPNQICSLTAQARNDTRGVGVTVVQNCTITAEKEFSAAKPPAKAYLGRPMKEYSRTIVMESSIDGFIAPEGWTQWMGTYGLDTLYYGEYKNRGAGADTSKRVTWKGIQKMTPELADSFTPTKVYAGDDSWVKNTAIPYTGGMVNPK